MTSLVNTMTFHRQHPVASCCLETRPLLSKENPKPELGVFSVSPLWRSYLYNWKLNHDICINTDQLFNLLSRVRKWVREMVGCGGGGGTWDKHHTFSWCPLMAKEMGNGRGNFSLLKISWILILSFAELQLSHPLLSGFLLHDNIPFPT